MAYIFTCQYCNRQYSVYEEGNYVCACGNQFHYPAAVATLQANFTLAEPIYTDSSSKSVKRSTIYHCSSHRSRSIFRTKECPLAKISLICACLSLLFFGILAIPALIMGFAARIMIADKSFHYTGDNIALAAIIISTISFSCWGVWLILFVS